MNLVFRHIKRFGRLQKYLYDNESVNVMKWVAIVICILFLTACAQTEKPSEITYKSEVVDTKLNETGNVTVNQSIEEPSEILLQNDSAGNNTNTSDVTGAVVGDTYPATPEEMNVTPEEELSIADQYRLMPALKSAVMNSSCYDIMWDGFDEHKKNWPVEIVKELRFEYLSGQRFKGWILSRLMISRLQLDSQSTVVMVENLSVSCPDKHDFSVDWEFELARLRH